MPEAELHKDYWHTVKDVNLFLYITQTSHIDFSYAP